MDHINKLENIWVAIIAGGKGTRLFPLSHMSCPKQFCQLDSENTFIQATAKRFIALGILPEHVVVLTTNDGQTELAKKQLKSLGVIEPNIYQISDKYGYAGAMVKTNLFIAELDENAIVINTPSDQYIVPSAAFTETVMTAVDNAEKDNPTILGVKVNDMVTFTGCGHAVYDLKDAGVCKKVKGFVEKPKEEEAVKMMRARNTACNTGINVWHVKTMINAIKGIDLEAGELATDKFMSCFKQLYLAIGKFEWHDCGTLKSLYDISAKTPNHKNASLGEGGIDRANCRRSLFYSVKGVNIYASNCEDVAVVANEINDHIFIAIIAMEKCQLVKQLTNDFPVYAPVLGNDFSIMARNNIIPYTNYSDEINVGLVGVHGYTISAIKHPDGSVDVTVSGKSKTSASKDD